MTTGARSGQPRTVRLLAVPLDDGYLILAANSGSEQYPAWYHNIRSNPRVVIDNGSSERGYTARELDGDERAAGFERALLLNPGWTRFRRRAGARAIPVLRLSAQMTKPKPGKP